MRFKWLLTLLFAASSSLMADSAPLRVLPDFTIQGMTFRKVEVAEDDATRAKGLSGRTFLPEDSGMLFVYPTPDVLCFWMKGTLIGLDVIFLDAQGRVVSVATMPAEAPRRSHESQKDYEQRLPLYCSQGRAVCALEVRAGMAAALGIRPGTIIPDLALKKVLKR